MGEGDLTDAQGREHGPIRWGIPCQTGQCNWYVTATPLLPSAGPTAPPKRTNISTSTSRPSSPPLLQFNQTFRFYPKSIKLFYKHNYTLLIIISLVCSPYIHREWLKVETTFKSKWIQRALDSIIALPNIIYCLQPVIFDSQKTR